MNNTISSSKPAATYQPNIKRKHRQPRHAIRRLLRSFEPLQLPGRLPAKPPYSAGN